MNAAVKSTVAPAAAKTAPACPPYIKFTTEEVMELVQLFNVSPDGLRAIRATLDREPKPPSAHLFRYYNERSRVVELEKRFAAHLGSKYALGVNSGTSALIAALVAASVGPGDEVIVPAYTFFASASAIVMAKAIPAITEVDESLTLDPAAVERAITPRTKAILVVHMRGHPARMDALRDIAKKRGLVLVEDVAQATGGRYQDRFLGAWGDLGCFSFDAYKVMATGEGGMITTDNEWFYTRAQSYHDTAACWRPDRYARERKPGELFCGENYRMSEMSGAIGLAQLAKLDETNRATNRLYHRFRRAIALPKGVRYIEPLDSAGVCGYSLGFLFDKVDSARKAATAKIELGGMVSGGAEGARDWHLYSFWEHVLEQKTPTSEGCPFRCPHVKELPRYSVDMCPRTSDILMRTLFLAIHPRMTDEWVDGKAKQISEGLARALA